MKKIEIKNTNEFNIKDICECGQLFRYKKTQNGYIIYETDQKHEVCVHKTPLIYTNNIKRAENYFDLNTNYDTIKLNLKGSFDCLDKAIEFGGGIRILKQDLTEVIISFIISANNNIPRIQKTIEALCQKFGKNCGDYFAFPTLEQLAKISQSDFEKLGAGYRSGQLVKTIDVLSQTNFLSEVKLLPTKEARKKLIELSGIGPKVADCILLFGLGRTDVFPADVWIKKLYHQNFGGKQDEQTDKVSKFFVDLFKENSGYAQQYLYYYKRSLKGEE